MLNGQEKILQMRSAEPGEDYCPHSPFELSCACANARRAARAVTQLFDQVLSPSGVTISQFVILQALEERGPLSQCRLSEGMVIAVETLSRRLTLMRRLGWIELLPRRDRRKRVYSLTEAGTKKFQCAFPYWVRAQRRLEIIMGEEQMREAIYHLKLLTNASREAIWARLPNVA